MLNGTLSATERTLCCLLENYQTPDGVRCVVSCVAVGGRWIGRLWVGGRDWVMPACLLQALTPALYNIIFVCACFLLPCRVPEVLQPFMMGIDFIPFRKQYDAKGKLVDRPVPAAAVPAAAASSMSTS